MRLAIILSVLLAAPAFAHDHSAAGHEHAPAAATPIQHTADGAVYGAELPSAAATAIPLGQAMTSPKELFGKASAFSGRITEVCQKQGCWMVLSADNGEFARVFMHDHAFGVPKDATGDAVVYGTLKEKTLSAEQVEHLQQEGSSSASARELQIDATSVLIRGAG